DDGVLLLRDVVDDDGDEQGEHADPDPGPRGHAGEHTPMAARVTRVNGPAPWLGGRAGRAGAPSLAGPEPDRSGIHVDELARRVQPDAAELLILRPRVELQRGDLRDEEVDRVALGMIAVPRDLVALLAQEQVVLRV